jgi:hypothetical protein
MTTRLQAGEKRRSAGRVIPALAAAALLTMMTACHSSASSSLPGRDGATGSSAGPGPGAPPIATSTPVDASVAAPGGALDAAIREAGAGTRVEVSTPADVPGTSPAVDTRPADSAPSPPEALPPPVVAAPPPPGAPWPGKDSIVVPKTVDGRPARIGILVLGHSTSSPANGDYAGKVAKALEIEAGDGRTFKVWRTTVCCGGGITWSKPFFTKNEPEFHLTGDKGGGNTCESGGVKWNCRRAALDTFLGGKPYPSCCDASNVPPRRDEWLATDFRIALIQDTAQRRWQVFDHTGDGKVDESDYFKPRGDETLPAFCGGKTGLVNGHVDFDCDGKLTPADSGVSLYAGWMKNVAHAMLRDFGPAGVHHVFVSPKPMETSGRGVDESVVVTPTPSKPFNHPYLPYTFWEYRAVEHLLALPDVDPRVHMVFPGRARAMHDFSVKCFETGLKTADFAMPAALAIGRPASIEPDIMEGKTATEAAGCYKPDEVHHNDNGGWMMADIWWSGIRYYLRL